MYFEVSGHQLLKINSRARGVGFCLYVSERLKFTSTPRSIFSRFWRRMFLVVCFFYFQKGEEMNIGEQVLCLTRRFAETVSRLALDGCTCVVQSTPINQQSTPLFFKRSLQ